MGGLAGGRSLQRPAQRGLRAYSGWHDEYDELITDPAIARRGAAAAVPAFLRDGGRGRHRAAGGGGGGAGLGELAVGGELRGAVAHVRCSGRAGDGVVPEAVAAPLDQ